MADYSHVNTVTVLSTYVFGEYKHSERQPFGHFGWGRKGDRNWV